MSPGLASPAFSGDDGTIDPRLAEALTVYRGAAELPAVLVALGEVRLIVPIVAVLDESRPVGDKEADMSAVLLTGADGRKALLAFSSLASMQAWDRDARPVSVYGAQAASAALDDGATAIVLDLAGDCVVIETADLVHLAGGERLMQTPAGHAWISPPR